MKNIKNMNVRNDRNDKVMDIILEAASDKYAQDIADEDIECDMTIEEEKVMLEQKERIYKNVMSQIRKQEKIRHRSIVKKCAVLTASLAIIIGFAANVSALRIFIFKTYTDMSGTFLNIKTEKVVNESYNVISEFEYKDEIIVPGWLPSKFFLTQITDDYTGVTLEYHSEDSWITIDENTISDSGTETQIETDNNDFSVENNKILNMDGITVEICSETGNNIFIVNWNSDNVKYELSTNCSKIMLDTILHQLKFLK